MASALQQVVFLAALTAALAAVDPCSEVYPGLGVDFATTQTKTVALSFDDAPDPTNTAKVLDDLAAAGLHATFFVNTNNQMSVANDGSAQALLKRIVAENHTLGSHTVDHISLDELSTTRIEYEIGGLETELATLGLPIPKLFRPPHGTPFIHNTADVPRVASVLRKHAVMILWTFAGNPTLDWDCDTSVQCVLNNYLAWFQSGVSGIPLMHAVKAGTAAALPQLLAAGKAAGVNFVSVNDFVQEKYGMSPADVVNRINTVCPDSGWAVSSGGGSSSSSSGSSSSGASTGGSSAASSGSGNNNNAAGRRGGPAYPSNPGARGGTGHAMGGQPADILVKHANINAEFAGGPGQGGPGGPGGGPGQGGPGQPGPIGPGTA